MFCYRSLNFVRRRWLHFLFPFGASSSPLWRVVVTAAIKTKQHCLTEVLSPLYGHFVVENISETSLSCWKKVLKSFTRVKVQIPNCKNTVVNIIRINLLNVSKVTVINAEACSCECIVYIMIYNHGWITEWAYLAQAQGPQGSGNHPGLDL